MIVERVPVRVAAMRKASVVMLEMGASLDLAFPNNDPDRYATVAHRHLVTTTIAVS